MSPEAQERALWKLALMSWGADVSGEATAALRERAQEVLTGARPADPVEALLAVAVMGQPGRALQAALERLPAGTERYNVTKSLWALAKSSWPVPDAPPK
ncbi:cytokinesis regulator [Chlorella sorokiniana]|uniref:Cytokinesis regulator n=1 Tax=Chlorella sorokiniana TaxID=3076 RepID=A0A2P6TL49_CHLSO|nr:cytokinesis regulator [Chlorella sorokiniana]|eukprot:PRW45004.1 cytokinesis regulator [Chlorella sorokiniana]